MKIEMTPEEHARLHRRRGRQALGLVIAVLVLIGVLTVLHAGVDAVAKLFDDTAQKQEYEDKLHLVERFMRIRDQIKELGELTRQTEMTREELQAAVTALSNQILEEL